MTSVTFPPKPGMLKSNEVYLDQNSVLASSRMYGSAALKSAPFSKTYLKTRLRAGTIMPIVEISNLPGELST